MYAGNSVEGGESKKYRGKIESVTLWERKQKE